MPIFTSLLPKNLLIIKKCCIYGAWRWRGGKFGGVIHLKSPNTGKTREKSTIWGKFTKTLTLSCYPLFNLLDDKQVGFINMVYSLQAVEKPFGNFCAGTSPKFSLKFRVEMGEKLPRTSKPFNSPKI